MKITCGKCRGEGVWEYWKCHSDPDKPDCALSAQARAAIEAAEGGE